MVPRVTGSRSSGNFARRVYETKDILHIRKPQSPDSSSSPDKQEIIQERIISPELQRAHGDAVFTRSFLSRSASISSGKKLQNLAKSISPIPPVPSPTPPPANESEGREKVASPTTKIRRSMAPSFANSRPSTRAESRCESRQSDLSEATSSSSVEAGSECKLSLCLHSYPRIEG